MNPQAIKQADDQFYKNHPDRVDPVTGARKPLTMDEKDKSLRDEWWKDYKAADEASKMGFAVCDVGGVLAPCPDALPGPPPAPAAAPAPLPKPAPPSCSVEVRANKLSTLGYYHMFVVYTDETGKQYYFRGGPSAGGPGSSGLSSELSGGSSHTGSVKSSASSSESSQSSSQSSQSPDSSQSSSSDSSGSSRPSQPSGSNPSSSSDSSGGGGGGGPFGYIVTQYGEYKPGTIDWDPGAKAVTVESSPGTCGKYDDLKKAFDGVAASKTRYNPLGPNSNSTVFSALKNVGIAPQLPDDVWAPGYDTPIDIP
jgi:hypothetical protein